MAASGTFEVHGGAFKKGKHHYFRPCFVDSGGVFKMKVKGYFFREKIKCPEQVQDLELATEENVKRLGGTVGWGVVGAALLGPVGLLAGLLAGGRSKEVTFICVLKDGRRFMATAPSKLYTEMAASRF